MGLQTQVPLQLTSHASLGTGCFQIPCRVPGGPPSPGRLQTHSKTADLCGLDPHINLKPGHTQDRQRGRLEAHAALK